MTIIHGRRIPMKTTGQSFAIILIFVVSIFDLLPVYAGSGQEIKVGLTDEEEIRKVIQNYFDMRYRSRATYQIEDFRVLSDGSPQSESFVKSETVKLEIEIHNAKLHHLGYTYYEYTLKFSDILIDNEDFSATVSLIEGHDVIFEISEIISDTMPIISKMRNISHTIGLKKTQDGWKIVSDYYKDNLWRMLRTSNYTKDDLLNLLDASQNKALLLSGSLIVTSSCNLPADDSTRAYNRSGAISYAHQYAFNPNPDYYYFPGNDCANFVNQAIHHGSNAEEVGSNTFGWYYNYYNSYNDNDYSASWTDVIKLYEFITQYYVWDKGPEGCEVDQYNALPGDLVQFEWQNDEDPEWDHTVIIVQQGSGGYGNLYWVAGHTDDMDNYPLNSIIYQNRRFLRIDRIDGYYKLYIPLIIRDLAGDLQHNITDPYPAPLEDGPYSKPQPYPAPLPNP
jgi:hypothetical protein